MLLLSLQSGKEDQLNQENVLTEIGGALGTRNRIP